MPSHDFEPEVELFFSCGERITDAAKLVLSARCAELRGENGEALLLYVQSGEILEECGPDSAIRNLRGEVKDAVRRLTPPT